MFFPERKSLLELHGRGELIVRWFIDAVTRVFRLIPRVITSHLLKERFFEHGSIFYA